MRHFFFPLIAITSVFFIGCPAKTAKQATIGQNCLLEYSVSFIEAAGSEPEACTALMDAIDGKEEAFSKAHVKVFASPSENLAKVCGDSDAVRVRFLDNDTKFRVRCAMSCPGHDNTPNCN